MILERDQLAPGEPTRIHLVAQSKGCDYAVLLLANLSRVLKAPKFRNLD